MNYWRKDVRITSKYLLTCSSQISFGTVSLGTDLSFTEKVFTEDR